MSLQTIRDYVIYNQGYFSGRSFSLSNIVWDAYGTAISKGSSLISLPLPFLSFLALPFFGSTSTTINLAFFWLTWSAAVWSYDPLQVEIYGTLVIKLMFFLLPSLGFLAFDAFVPSLSASMKAAGDKQLPSKGLSRHKLTTVAAIATFNTLLGVAVQAAIEYVLTEHMSFRSGLRVSTLVPPPWSMAKDVLRALFVRGILHYGIHRFVLHASPRSFGPLARWHQTWAHGVRYSFSLVAAHDHPVCYLLADWLPLYLPALVFRYHVLTWHILVAFTSLEQLFIYSGYAVLPSRILLAGMARRTDSHYESKGEGNFGHWGVLDWACGTTCGGEADVMDDLRDEADEHNVQERISDVKKNAKGAVSDTADRFGGEDEQEDAEEDAQEDAQEEDQQEDAQAGAPEEEPESPSNGGKRRSKRRAGKAAARS